jgi:hypothetical protein
MKFTNVACLDILTTLSQCFLVSSLPTNRGDIDAIRTRGHGSNVMKGSQTIAEVKKGIITTLFNILENGTLQREILVRSEIKALKMTLLRQQKPQGGLLRPATARYTF